MRHAQACNAVERIFGVVKKRWDILNHAPQFSMPIQAKISPGLPAVHNFILDHDEEELDDLLNQLGGDEEPPSTGEAGDGAINAEERRQANYLQDQIATEMWDSYQQYVLDHPDIFNDTFIPETF